MKLNCRGVFGILLIITTSTSKSLFYGITRVICFVLDFNGWVISVVVYYIDIRQNICFLLEESDKLK